MTSPTPDQQPHIPHPMQPHPDEATMPGTIYRSSYAESTHAVSDPTDLGRPATKGTVYFSANHSSGGSEAEVPALDIPEAPETVSEETEVTDAPEQPDALHEQLVAEEAAFTEEDISKQIQRLRGSVREYRDEERVNFWEAHKDPMAGSAYREVLDILNANKDSWADTAPGVYKQAGDAFDTVMMQIARDIRGTTDPDAVRRGPDVAIAFAPGQELGQQLDGADLQDPTVLAKATQTIRLLAANGRYKFFKWNASDQLGVALDLLESYAKSVPDFNLVAAGAMDVKWDLTVCAAAVRYDNTTKPNFRYAMPERAHTLYAATTGLAKLDVAIAHKRAHIMAQTSDAEQTA